MTDSCSRFCKRAVKVVGENIVYRFMSSPSRTVSPRQGPGPSHGLKPRVVEGNGARISFRSLLVCSD